MTDLRKLRNVSVAILLAAAPPGRGGTLVQAPTAATAPASPPAAAPLAPLGCAWPELTGTRLLDRRLGPVSFKSATVWEVVHRLIRERHVPLSFIEDIPAVRLSIELGDGTLRQVLNAVVAHLPRYRYAFVGSRLVLYPHDSPWDTGRLDGMNFGPGPRRRVGIDLVEELLRRVPALAQADLRDPWLFGNPENFLYQDPVEVKGPGSPLELFVQLLGSRASAVFTVNKIKGTRGMPLWFNSADLVQSVELTPAETDLVHRDQTVQLKLVGTLYDGTHKDLTSIACGTEYSVHDPKVIAVSPGGLVTVRGEGRSIATAFNEHLATAIFNVKLSGKPRSSPPPARGRTTTGGDPGVN